MDMMKDFQRQGFQVVAVGQEHEAEWTEKFRDLGIRYRAIPVSRNGLNPLADLKTYRSIHALLKEEKPDRIFCYQAKTVIYGCLAAGRLGLHEIYPMIAGLGSVFRGTGFKNALVRTILKREYRLALKHARRVMFQNEDDQGCFTVCGLLPKEKSVIIHGSGVDVQAFKPMAFPQRTTFLMTARLLKDKGVFEYLEAAERIREKHPEVHFLLVGPFDTNPSAMRPEQLQRYLDAGIVEYLGELSDVRPALARASVFVLPSYHEGTPKTVLEAMACGRPVITTDAPGCRETVQDGKNGFLVPVRNSIALVEAMEKFIGSPKTGEQMGLAGRRLVEEKYDVHVVNQAIMSVMDIAAEA